MLRSPTYTKLWDEAPAYEKDLLDRCEDLSRRVYRLLSRKSKPGFEGGTQQRVYHTVALQPRPGSGMTDDELAQWYEEEHIPMLTKVPGWLRSSRWALLDVKGANMKEVDATKVGRWLAVHEWETEAVYETKEHKEAVATPWRNKVMDRIDTAVEERRKFKVWKDFPCN